MVLNSTRSTKGLQQQSNLERLVAEIVVPTYHATHEDLATLQDFENHCWHSEDESGYYATLLRTFAVLKAGPEACHLHRNHLTLAWLLSEKKQIPEAAAIRWILGRINLSCASLSLPLDEKIVLTEEALSLFSKIESEPLNLRMLIPLPGARQELSEKSLRFYGNKLNDPVTNKFSAPHRYIGSAAISLSELDRSKGDPLCEMALAHAKLAERIHPNSLAAPRLNVDLLVLGTQAVRRHRGQKDISLKQCTKEVEAIADRVTECLRAGDITEIKALEWIANLHASHALIANNGNQYQDALDKAILNIKLLAKAKGLVPDFIGIDPIYRLAFERSGTFSEFLRELSHK